jgi:hypothetical protein
MTGREIVEQINAQRSAEDAFIKWWRREEDWLDYDLIDRFVANVQEDETIDGFELVGVDEIWEELRRLSGKRVEKVKRGGEELLIWQRENGEKRECLFTPQNLLDLFDAETGGNYVD